jgi:hypothetical protein
MTMATILLAIIAVAIAARLGSGVGRLGMSYRNGRLFRLCRLGPG